MLWAAESMLAVSEIFESVQGEGASAGEEAVFLRLAHCNLRCCWCDTKYTWDWAQYDQSREVKQLDHAAVREQLLSAGARRLIITGGEPLIQSARLERLLAELDARAAFVVEVETNGTFAPSPGLAQRIDQWNVSPKLSNSGDPAARRLVPQALRALRATNRAWLKVVVASPDDRHELEALLEEVDWPHERVLLMPLGAERQELRRHLPVVEELAGELRVGVSRRLHVERWGGKRGV